MASCGRSSGGAGWVRTCSPSSDSRSPTRTSLGASCRSAAASRPLISLSVGVAERRVSAAGVLATLGVEELLAAAHAPHHGASNVGPFPRPLESTLDAVLSEVGGLGHSHTLPAEKSEIKFGVAVSIPTMSNIPVSVGSAIVNPFETMPTTTSLASMPIASRYRRNAWTGLI